MRSTALRISWSIWLFLYHSIKDQCQQKKNRADYWSGRVRDFYSGYPPNLPAPPSLCRDDHHLRHRIGPRTPGPFPGEHSEPAPFSFEIRLFDILRFVISSGCLLQSKEDKAESQTAEHQTCERRTVSGTSKGCSEYGKQRRHLSLKQLYELCMLLGPGPRTERYGPVYP